MRARTRALARTVDLDAFAGPDGMLFVRDGVGLAGRGVAARVTVEDVAGALAAIETTDEVGEPGCGPVAFGALPFLPGSPAEMVLPAVVVGRGPDGHRWVTEIDGAEADLTPAPSPRAAAAEFAVRPLTPVAAYLEAVDAARRAVRNGDLDKVVIARDVLVSSSEPLDEYAIALRLRASFGSSYRYRVDGLLGASPELLVARHRDICRSHPLAGTAPRRGDPATDARAANELLASVKNQLEHRVVIDAVHDTLLPYCSYLDWEPEPSLLAVANVVHLATLVEGRFSSPPPNVVDLVRLLSPTPALGGHPRDAALAMIEQLEHSPRGRYGGAVGWVDAAGNGTWAVTIRGAELSADRLSARLFAGGGIVAASEPYAELEETQSKLQAMLSAIIRP